MSTYRIQQDPMIDDNLKRELVGYKNQVFNMRFWLVFYTTGLLYIFRMGSLNFLGKLGLTTFFFIPNFYHYRKNFKSTKIKILNTMIDLEIDKIKSHGTEQEVLQFNTAFDEFLNKNL